MKQFLKKHWKYIAFLLTTNTVLFVYYMRDLKLTHSVRSKYLPVIIIAYIIIQCLITMLYYFLKEKKKLSLEKIFLVLALVLGTAHILVTPLDQTPDELAHIYRSYEISQGNILPEKSEDGHYYARMPITAYNGTYLWRNDHKVYKRILDNMFVQSEGEKNDGKYDVTATYHPVGYMPQVAGLKIGQAIRLPDLMTFYLGRLISFIVFILCCYFALNIMPKYKEFLLFFMILPETLQQSMSFNPDSLLMGACFLLIAFVSKYIYEKDSKITNRSLACICILAVIIACCKTIVYLPILLMYLMIPYDKFNSKRQKYIGFMVIIALALAAEFIWIKLSPSMISSTDSTSFLLSNPFKVLLSAVGTGVGVNTTHYIEGMLGMHLSYGNVKPPINIYLYVAIILFVIMLFRNTEKIVFNKFNKALYWIIPIAVVGLLYAAAFTQWDFNGKESNVIAGIQGRYLLPIMPLIPFLVDLPKEHKVLRPLDTSYIFLFGIFINMCSLGCKFLYNI